MPYARRSTKRVSFNFSDPTLGHHHLHNLALCGSSVRAHGLRIHVEHGHPIAEGMTGYKQHDEDKDGDRIAVEVIEKSNCEKCNSLQRRACDDQRLTPSSIDEW